MANITYIDTPKKLGSSVTIFDATLTASYVAGVIDLDTTAHANVGLFLTFIKDDSSSCEILVQTSPDEGVAWFTEGIVSGSDLAKHAISLLSANYDSTDRVSIQVSTPAAHLLRVMAKKTGGSGTVTLKVEAIAGMGA